MLTIPVPSQAFEPIGAIATHAALLTGVHGLAITAGKVLTVQDNVTILGALGSAAYTADSNYLGAAAQAVDSAKLGGSLPAAYALVGQTMNIGTTAVNINRASGALVLTGITSIDGTAANASQLLTGTWAVPGTIGSTTPNTGVFTNLYVNKALNGDVSMTAQNDTDGTAARAILGVKSGGVSGPSVNFYACSPLYTGIAGWGGKGILYGGGTTDALVINASKSTGEIWFNIGGIDLTITRKVTIKSTGYLGINTPTPSGMLDVHGAGTTTGVCFQTADSGGNAKFTVLDNGTVTSVGNVSVNATLTSIHTFTDANWNEDASTWTMAANGPLVHVTGNTTAVTATNTEAIVAGTTYKVTITGTGGGGTATYTLGGVTGTTIAATGTIAITDYIVASTTASLIITPASACTVSITSITIEKRTAVTGDLTVEGNLTARSQILVNPLGTTSSAFPAYSFAGYPTYGMAYWGSGLRFIINGTNALSLTASALQTSGYLYIGADDTVLLRLAANSLAQRNSTNPQTFSIFETYTDSSNYERYSFVTGSDALTISALSAGTGSANLGITLSPKGTGALNMGISTSLLGFYGVTAIARAVLATGVGATVDNIIAALQNLGLVKQA